jgi:hypothetical protein
MEEKARVKVDEVDLGFCLLHVLYFIYPCGFINQ